MTGHVIPRNLSSVRAADVGERWPRITTCRRGDRDELLTGGKDGPRGGSSFPREGENFSSKARGRSAVPFGQHFFRGLHARAPHTLVADFRKDDRFPRGLVEQREDHRPRRGLTTAVAEAWDRESG